VISIAEAARAIGLNRSTLSRQVRRGLIRSYPNGVVLAEVIADRATNIGRVRRSPDNERIVRS
jgi:hypothetical protein